MDKYIIEGGKKLSGEIAVSGAKNVAMKVLLAGLLTEDEIKVSNIPFISSVKGTVEIVVKLGVKVKYNKNHSIIISGRNVKEYYIPLELGGLFRTATMVIGPLLNRFGKAKVPNPGGCRLGKRPIERHIDGLKKMGAKISYDNEGYFEAKADKLSGTEYKFDHNTHTGTETLILAAVLADGETVLKNAALEPEIDDLINLLTLMGAKVKRGKDKTIIIKGVKKLKGATYKIMPDRNEVITWAVAAMITKGDIIIRGVKGSHIKSFLERVNQVGGKFEWLEKEKMRFYANKSLSATNIVTKPYPGFMTDWQAPWAVLMTQAGGISTIHESIYEDRFGYVKELKKMGAIIDFFEPKIKNPNKFYNFNLDDKRKDRCQAIRIKGPTKLHNGVLEVTDLRAGATLILGALVAEGKSIIHGIEHIDRGYESIDKRLHALGADIKKIKK